MNPDTPQIKEKQKALTAYLPHLSNNVEIHHWDNCTDDDGSKRSFGDVVEGWHEKGQGKQHNCTCKNKHRQVMKLKKTQLTKV